MFQLMKDLMTDNHAAVISEEETQLIVTIIPIYFDKDSSRKVIAFSILGTRVCVWFELGTDIAVHVVQRKQYIPFFSEFDVE